MKEMSDYISHFGVKGMKWGIRRYQNRDGSLTPEGRKRYGRSEDSEKVRELRKKPVSAMSNQELETVIRRMNLERQYRDLKSSEINSGKKKAKEVLDYANTASQFYNLYNSPMGKATKSAIKKAWSS